MGGLSLSGSMPTPVEVSRLDPQMLPVVLPLLYMRKVPAA